MNTARLFDYETKRLGDYRNVAWWWLVYGDARGRPEAQGNARTAFARTCVRASLLEGNHWDVGDDSDHHRHQPDLAAHLPQDD